ncbi:growth hormone receptor b isoform X2 [Thalassophryne amazonica]|nr:growth hormone receptor b isoform X2 [Thalassophryne amazonica]
MNTMAAALVTVLLFLHTFTASTFQPTSDLVLLERHPHLTGCVSADMETFRCRWNVGTFLNLSELGELRFFYIRKETTQDSPKEWTECPHYSTERQNECFFNKNHTSVWTNYGVQLRSRDQSIVYDEDFFVFIDIVQPDPPVDLNWTLLNVSMTGNFLDIMLRWRPPQSADVETGWMTLQYEVQHRAANSDLWKVVSVEKGTQCSLYGLQTNIDHEVRVRCKRLGSKDFGEFSESIFIHVPLKDSRFPVVGLLIFGALCLVAILMLVIISHQEKLMVILLPPVPGPKIKGIDPELLKKGKLKELTSILGGHPDLRPELYNNDPWVEFIDLDIEEHNDRLTDLDMDCLMDPSLSTHCSPLSMGFRDDDSGHASCCDPDLPIDPEMAPFHSLLSNPTISTEVSCPSASPDLQSLPAGAPSFTSPTREALYTQVSEVKSSGEVLLEHEDQNAENKDSEMDNGEKEKEKKELKLMMVNVDHGGYTSGVSTASPQVIVTESCQSKEDFSLELPPSSADDWSPQRESDVIPSHPAPVYTVVDGVNIRNSLLLTPDSVPTPQIIMPKAMPTPEGYLTPDLLGSITP